MKAVTAMALMALALAGCASTPNTPEDICAAEANRDPKVVAMREEMNGNIQMQQSLAPAILAARRQAMNACLARMGVGPPGGVQPPQRR
jgi:hypothetical protein